MTIPDKKTFKRLSELGVLGNRFRYWNSIVEVLKSGYKGGVYIRGPVAGWKWMMPWVDVSCLVATVSNLARRSGTPASELQYVEVLPFGTPRSINGEMGWMTQGPVLRYGTSAELSLRHDLEENGIELCGLKAVHRLASQVPPEDVLMLYEIWDQYPQAIIEFTTYADEYVGIYKRKTVVWEVRDY